MFEQERMIGRLQRKVASESDIFACFLSGSYGRRTNDEFSDLDIALVFADAAAKTRAWRNREQFAQSIMPYLALKSFDAQHIRPFFHIALYANGSKLDFRYEERHALNPNPWDSQIRILKDSQNWAESFQMASAQMIYPQPVISKTELINIDRRFWIMFWDIVRQLARGDSDRPFTIYLELLYFTLPALVRALPPSDPARKLLTQIHYETDAKNSMQSMITFFDGYIAVRSALIKHYSLQITTDTSFEFEFRKLLDRFA